MASIKERIKKNGDRTYQITVSMGYTEDGRKLLEKETFKPEAQTPAAARKEAELEAANFEKRLKEGNAYMDGRRISFKAFVKQWDDNYLSVQVITGNMTQKSREDYNGALKRYAIPAIGHLKLSEIKPINIDGIVKNMIDKGKSPKTIRNTFNVINAILNYAFENEIIAKNPCTPCRKRLPVIKRDGEKHHFTEDQVKRFLNDALTLEYQHTVSGHKRELKTPNGLSEYEVKPYTEKKSVSLQFRVFFTLAVYSGCRRGELVALTWNKIDAEAKTITISSSITASHKNKEEVKEPKTEAGKRTITLPDVCFTLLNKLKLEQRQHCMKLGTAWKGKRGKDYDDNFIFIQENGERMNLQTPSKKFRTIVDNYNKTVPEELQLPRIKLHDLRHTNASHLIAQGVDIETIAKRLGHSKASFTYDVYGHAIETMDKKASDALASVFSAAN